jgi:hypothetical protein
MIDPTKANRTARRMRELLSRSLREAVVFVTLKKI